jgi:hypothetical protein
MCVLNVDLKRPCFGFTCRLNIKFDLSIAQREAKVKYWEIRTLKMTLVLAVALSMSQVEAQEWQTLPEGAQLEYADSQRLIWLSLRSGRATKRRNNAEN